MAMYGATIGKLGILNIPATTNQACCACIPYGGVYILYLFYYLMGARQSFIFKGHGGAQPNISKDIIINSLMPLPPYKEQKRIVEILSQLLEMLKRKWHKMKVNLIMKKERLGVDAKAVFDTKTRETVILKGSKISESISEAPSF